jgi:hypothetical protein
MTESKPVFAGCPEAAARLSTFVQQARQGRAEKRVKSSSRRGAVRKGNRRPPREPVGTALANRIEGLIGVKAGSGCNCRDLAEKMNLWGIAGCEKRRAEIVAALVANRDILTKALEQKNWLAGAVSRLTPDIMLEAGAEYLLNAAINDARTCSPPAPVVRPKRLRPPQLAPKAGQVRKALVSLKREQDRLFALNNQQPPPTPDPFIGEPVLHFGAHLWPVKGNWEWHVNLWNMIVPLINGKCFVGIATDGSTDTFETVKAALHPSFICYSIPNSKEGENPTFRWLQEVVPQSQDDVLIYCHGKGVRQHTAASEAVRRWSEAMYQTVVFNHDMIREKMAAGYVNVHSFRTFGTRPLSPAYKWHPSGTFFAVRAKHLSNKPVGDRYGSVEAWPGRYFKASDTWCEFFDNSMFTTLYDHEASKEIVAPMLTEWWRKQNYER